MVFLRIHKRNVALQEYLQKNELIWALRSICMLKHIAFDAEALIRQFSPPYTTDTLIIAAKELDLRILRISRPSCKISGKTLPSLALCQENKYKINAKANDSKFTLDLITHMSGGQITYFSSSSTEQKISRCDDYAMRYTGSLFLIAHASQSFSDPET